MRSRKLALLREESIAFENRRLKWMANADAQDDIEEFLVHQIVSLSLEIERLDQARHERIANTTASPSPRGNAPGSTAEDRRRKTLA
jgi:hypothetical protein